MNNTKPFAYNAKGFVLEKNKKPPMIFYNTKGGFLFYTW